MHNPLYGKKPQKVFVWKKQKKVYHILILARTQIGRPE